MILYKIQDIEINVHCIFCGTDVGPENEGDCEHFMFHTTESSNEHEHSKIDNILSKMTEDDFLGDFLEENLDDTYLTILLQGPQMSSEIYYIFKSS